MSLYTVRGYELLHPVLAHLQPSPTSTAKALFHRGLFWSRRPGAGGRRPIDAALSALSPIRSTEGLSHAPFTPLLSGGGQR
jgi:hypothetical protein